MKFKFLRSAGFKWLLGISLVFGPFVIVPLWHNWQLWRLQNAIGTMKHPDNSRFVARYGEVNNFGNGNHIDFWAVELRELLPQSVAKTFQTATILNMAYEGKRLSVPNANDDDYQDVKNGTQPVEWKFLPSPLPKNYRLKMGNGTWKLSDFAGGRDLYIVQIANVGENDTLSAFYDGRGW